METQNKEENKNILPGAVALITGGSRGIGLAIALRLGELGARVAICGRDATRLEQAAGKLSGRGIEVLSSVADVTDADAVAGIVERVQSTFARIDILVNNAGVGIFGPFHERSEDEWNAVLNTNLKSVFLMSRAVVPEMIRRRSGQIVNISSLAGKNAFANGGIYCASKWGLMGLTGCMAEELRPHGIRVSAVCPGSVATEFSTHSNRSPETLLQAEDVAHAVAMLVTEGPHSFISEVDLRPRQKS